MLGIAKCVRYSEGHVSIGIRIGIVLIQGQLVRDAGCSILTVPLITWLVILITVQYRMHPGTHMLSHEMT
jgi:hypothetical protein